MILQDVFKDGMIKAMGVAQWWTDDNLEVVEDDYTNLTLEQRQFVISQPDTEVVQMEPRQRPGPSGEIIPIFDMTVRRTEAGAAAQGLLGAAGRVPHQPHRDLRQGRGAGRARALRDPVRADQARACRAP